MEKIIEKSAQGLLCFISVTEEYSEVQSRLLARGVAAKNVDGTYSLRSHDGKRYYELLDLMEHTRSQISNFAIEAQQELRHNKSKGVSRFKELSDEAAQPFDRVSDNRNAFLSYVTSMKRRAVSHWSTVMFRRSAAAA